MTSPIPDRAVLEGLLERVRSAVGSDRELDFAIHQVEVGAWLDEHGYRREGDSYVTDTPPIEGSELCRGPEPYTASLDAITALVASRGFGWQVDQTEGAFVSDSDDQWHETCATPVLSLVAAWLLAEMERTGEG